MKFRAAIAAAVLLVLVTFDLAPCLAQQAEKAGSGTASDYSTQAVVVESIDTAAVFHDDGTWTMTRSGRIRVQSQAGVQDFGMLQFPYASATTTLQIEYVRVVKPDKTVITTPAENALDMPADITRQAPFYSDLKVMQVAVKGLEAGSTLEFEMREDDTKPLDPGEFWNVFNFTRNAIVLQEGLEITVPSGRKVMVKSAKVQPTVSESAGNRVYTWKAQNLSVKTNEAQTADDDKLPDVQVTSFKSWDELGKWFGGLVASRAIATPEIKAKADELTRGATTDTEKIKDLYAFVSTKYRYIGIGLGIGRYQPHAAADVLSNDYGDCKDKHTLFEALLAAEGIKAYPALINSSLKIDPDVPSPSQFDHVITAIPQKQGFLFLDTTPEVTPFGYLTANLRDKSALVIPDTGPAQLVKTPADPPFPMFERFEADGALDATGTFTGKMRLTTRDDAEIILRYAFRQAGEAQWTEVMQKMSQNMGFGGTVSDVTVTPPEQTEIPLNVEYSYVRKDYSDFSDGWISPPFPPLFVAAVPDDASQKTKPLHLGSLEEILYSANIKLPAGMTPKLPDSVHLSDSFADFDATYTFTAGTLHVERKLVAKERDIQPAEFEAYGKFGKAIENDAKINIYIGGQGGQFSVFESSTNPEAVKLYSEGYQSWQMRDFPGAMEYFQQAVEKDPKYAQAWTALGTLHATMGPRDQGISELKKAIALDPSQPAAYQELGTVLLMQHQTEDALAVWKELEQASPANAMAAERICEILLELKRYPEAVTELEDAVKRIPGNATLLTQLGTAYSESGDATKAIPTFESALKADSSANNLNSVSYAMADANLDLTDALQGAQKAVSEEEAQTAKIDIDHWNEQDFAAASHLAAYWDTLGWAYFRTGDMEKARKYLNAGWHLSQDPTIADHLGQLYEKEGKAREARQAYAWAVATRHAPDHAMDRLKAMDDTKAFDVMPGSLQDMRIVQVALSPKPKEHASADFVVALSADGKVSARIVSGLHELGEARKAIEAAKFEMPFPDAGPATILRRGILDCEPELKQCSFAMYPLSYPQVFQTNPGSAPENAPGTTVLKLRPDAPPVVVKKDSDSSTTGSKSKQ